MIILLNDDNNNKSNNKQKVTTEHLPRKEKSCMQNYRCVVMENITFHSTPTHTLNLTKYTFYS